MASPTIMSEGTFIEKIKVKIIKIVLDKYKHFNKLQWRMIMEKRIFLLIVFFAILFNVTLFAQEESEKTDISRFSFGGGVFANDVSTGVFADFSIISPLKNNFDIQNHFVLYNAALGDTRGVVGLSWILSAGYLFFDILHVYGFVENGISGWGDNNKNGFFDGPVMYCLGAGGGINVFINRMFSIFSEIQWISYRGEGINRNIPMFKLGLKGYF